MGFNLVKTQPLQSDQPYRVFWLEEELRDHNFIDYKD